jgi:hypothetical protein
MLAYPAARQRPVDQGRWEGHRPPTLRPLTVATPTALDPQRAMAMINTAVVMVNCTGRPVRA